MKDSQRTGASVISQHKYIKVNNERFSTATVRPAAGG